MGAGASVPEGATLKDVPQMIDKETCENLFLDQIVDFDEAKFDEMAVDGQIRREVLEELGFKVTLPAAELAAAEEAAAAAAALEHDEVEAYATRVLAMSEEELAEKASEVMTAVEVREKALTKDAPSDKAADYSKSFSGTANDTKVEKDFGKMLAGDDEAEHADAHAHDTDPALNPLVTSKNCERYDEVRAAGKWLKVLGGAGCYLWCHSLTHETVSMRPEDYEEEVAEKEEVDRSYGLYKCKLADILDEIALCIDEEKKTPLIVDNSEEEKVRTFFDYKGRVEDISGLGLPLGQQRKKKIKPKIEMERLRQTTVNAIKAGATLVVNMGEMGGDCNFQGALCKTTVFPVQMFEEGGKKILTPSFPAPRCAKMFKDEDKESGEVVCKETFQMVLISNLMPSQVRAFPNHSLPVS
mmetsp:Transcript_98142/g.280913  ORF Transcript_98142/g.280913 Transcript_98142/m.280913 type:complete len:413 (+) Transcript_98142:204-1442(+)